MATQVEIASIVAMIGAAYPNFAPTKETVMVYYDLLKDLPADLLKVATLQCCAESGRKFAPSVGEIRGAVGDVKRQAQGVPSAIEAWGELLHAPKSEQTSEVSEDRDENGSVIIYVTPYKWSHPLVRKVAVMMGFPRFPDWESESFERTAFLKVYETELQAYLRQDTQLPEVTRFVEGAKNKMLNAGNQIGLLAERLTK